MDRVKIALSTASSTLCRLKTVGEDAMETQLRRCLTTLDITMLGVGHMIGAGVYVLTGAVMRDTAGPAIVLSFLLAGVASFLSALCYAEFGARVPKAGSAYTYSYVTIGELVAFIIGWNVILEHMLGAAAVARSWSGYLDTLLGHAITDATNSTVGTPLRDNPFLSDYPDFIALLIVGAVCVFMGYGAKTSTYFNTIFTIINLCVVVFIVIYGGTFADFDLWKPFNEKGKGFMPFGVAGVLGGAASCFFAYIGFDGLSSAAEEAQNPSQSIPLATLVSMSVVTTAYILMAGALSLMIPYNTVHPTSAFADAFEARGAIWAKYVVGVGAMSGMTTSLVGSMFALPRCVYAMAKDGLIFKSLATVHPETQVPTFAVTVFGAMTACTALLFNIETLVEFLSIGTLMAYTIVSGCTIILRYRPSNMQPAGKQVKPADEETMVDAKTPTTEDDRADLMSEDERPDCQAGRAKDLCGPLKPFFDRFPPGVCVAWAVGAVTVDFLLFGLALRAEPYLGPVLAGVMLLLTIGGAAACCLVIVSHKQNPAPLIFKVPLVPLVPICSIFINVMLMLHLDPITWLRLLVWLAIGLCIYFGYGVGHSVAGQEAGIVGQPAPCGSYNALGEGGLPVETSVQRVQPEEK